MARQPKTAGPKQKFNKGRCSTCLEDFTVRIVNGKLVRVCACTPTV